MVRAMMLRLLLAASLVLLLPTTASAASYTCDDTVNFIHGQQYHQISLTDGCTGGSPNVCNNNPVYVPAYAATTADGTTGSTADGAVAFCQSRCDSPTLFHAFSGQGDPHSPCSSCTGFFFQRHTNGHEICGFYTIDLNDKTLDKVGHGHSPGSRICTKTKLGINTTTTLADPTLAITEIMDRMVPSFNACGANAIVVGVPESGAEHPERAERALTFRYDISDGPSDLNSTEIMKRFVVSLFDGRSDRRRLENTRARPDLAGCVQELGSCMAYTCPAGWTYSAEPQVYCENEHCSAQECCQCTSGSCALAGVANRTLGRCLARRQVVPCEDFACCARNGNPIREIYPEQCTDPLSGTTFTKCYPDGTGCTAPRTDGVPSAGSSAGSSPSSGLFESRDNVTTATTPSTSASVGDLHVELGSGSFRCQLKSGVVLVLLAVVSMQAIL